MTGVGALAVVGAWDAPGSGWLLLALAAVHPLAAVMTRNGRGFSNTVAGLEVELTGRSDEPEAEVSPEPMTGPTRPGR